MTDLYRYTGDKKYLDFCNYIIGTYLSTVSLKSTDLTPLPSTQLPAGWVGSQLYRVQGLVNGKPTDLNLVPFAEAGQTGGDFVYLSTHMTNRTSPVRLTARAYEVAIFRDKAIAMDHWSNGFVELSPGTNEPVARGYSPVFAKPKS